MKMKGKKLIKKALRLSLFASIAFLGVLICANAFGIKIIFGQSMPKGGYRITGGAAKMGDLVEIHLPLEWSRYALNRGYVGYNFKGTAERRAIKYVIASEGDLVSIEPEGITVNGNLVPYSKQSNLDSKGREMPTLREHERVLLRGEFLVLSHQRDYGFDSRYYGILNHLNAHGRVKALYTFEEVLKPSQLLGTN